MILSMTGFGRGTAVRNGREITVELRSVNSRYFEYSSRIPRTCSYLDSRLKKQLNERISRGKVELSMTVQNVDAADTVVAVNMELARSYQQAMRDISEQLGVKNDISAGRAHPLPGCAHHPPRGCGRGTAVGRCFCRYGTGAGPLCGNARRRGCQDEGRRGKPPELPRGMRRQGGDPERGPRGSLHHPPVRESSRSFWRTAISTMPAC